MKKLLAILITGVFGSASIPAIAADAMSKEEKTESKTEKARERKAERTESKAEKAREKAEGKDNTTK
jgi:uncharacterized membrane protein YdbT with pleckstrin-like domain